MKVGKTGSWKDFGYKNKIGIKMGVFTGCEYFL
jgi:hypothetical protein